MKLNPPASSSDLDSARAVAQRLHQRATGQEAAAVPGKVPPSAPSPVGTAVTRPAPPAPPEPYPEPPAPSPGPIAPPREPVAPPPGPADLYPEPETEEDELEVSTDEGGEVEARASPSVPDLVETAIGSARARGPGAAELEAESDEDEESGVETSGSDPFQPGPFEISMPGLEEDEEEPLVEDDSAGGREPTDAEPFEATEEPAVEESSPFGEELTDPSTGAPAPPEEPPMPDEQTAPGTSFPPDEQTAPGETTPPPDAAPPAPGPPPDPWELEPDSEGPMAGDDALSALTEDAPQTRLEDLEPPAGPASPEDLVSGWGQEPLGEEPQDLEPAPDDLSTPPSWDDLADACLVAARAHGAMIVDPAGQVVTARGQWPEPGPEAIGRRLVTTMERTLGDAPTRSVSAPLAGEHLTAWRVPVAEGFLTVVFMAESTLDNDARGAVAAEIHGTLGQ